MSKKTTVILDDNNGNSWQFDIKPGEKLIVSPFPGKASEMILNPRQVKIVQQVMGQFLDTVVEPPEDDGDAESRLEDIQSLIEEYGAIDGDRHKQWVIDQIARIVLAEKYNDWVDEWRDDGCEWDEGIAP